MLNTNKIQTFQASKWMTSSKLW